MIKASNYNTKINSNIRKSINAICIGKYTSRQILVTAQFFVRLTILYLVRQNKYRQLIPDSHRNLNQALEDFALDLIGGLFARDNQGRFTSIQTYLGENLNKTDPEFQIIVERLIYITASQQLVRMYEIHDPFGRNFYRSIRYLIDKHPQWEKLSLPNIGPVIRNDPSTEYDLDSATIENIVYEQDLKGNSLTHCVERIVTEILNRHGGRISLRILLSIIRYRMIGSSGKGEGENNVYPDPNLELTCNQLISETIKYIKAGVINNYLEKKKFTDNECSAFASAIMLALESWIQDCPAGSLYENLCQFWPRTISREEYRNTLRVHLEHIWKEAKTFFSARAKTEIIVS